MRTRLTERWGIAHPVLSAPMAFAAGGALAAAVSRAGGLGLIGGGYGEAEWLARAFADAGNERVGCGFITWSLARQPALLERALAHAPAAVMLSFGDPLPFAGAVRAAGSRLICQVQTRAHALAALDAGAEAIVAQGTEAGGHGGARATLTLVPEIADLLARRSPETLLLAAGGIADGRGLAAALMLGADGVLMGSRFWASREAAVHPALHAAALGADGDGTLRQTAADIVRGYDWPAEFTGRVLRNGFTDRWHGREAELRERAGPLGTEYLTALRAGEADRVGVFAGEAVALIHDIPPAAELLTRIVAEAEERLAGAAALRG